MYDWDLGQGVDETQLTRQKRPIEHGWGSSGSVLSAEASFAARVEPDSAANPIASKPAVLSLIPNLRALELVVSAAGFRELTLLRARAPSQRPVQRARSRRRDRERRIVTPRAGSGVAGGNRAAVGPE